MSTSKTDRRAEKDAWELAVFDDAVYFTVSTFVGRQAGSGGRSIESERFDDLPAAVAAHARGQRTVLYAVNAAGRFSVLDTARLPEYLHRWHRRRHTPTEPENQDMSQNARPVFVIHWNGNGPSSAQVTRLANRELAERFSYEVLPGDRTALIVAEPGDLIGSSAQLLKTVYNALNPAKPVMKFESSAVARERVVRALAELNVPEHVWAAPVPAAPAALKTRKKKMTDHPAPASRAPRARTAPVPSDEAVRLAPTDVIAELKPNEKRPGTTAHASYALLRPGLTVAEYIAAGGHRGQLWWNVKIGNVKLKPRVAEAA